MEMEVEMVVVDVREKTKDEPYLFHHVHATAFGTALASAQRKTLTDQASGFSCTATSDFPASSYSYNTDSTTACDIASHAAASAGARTSTGWRRVHVRASTMCFFTLLS
jgi:hypothetical protein